jgi:hypothetical protein
MAKLRKRRAFTTISNDTCQRADLSLQAKGFLALLLSFPDDWEFKFDHLVACSKNEEHATRTAMNELTKAGYLHKVAVKDPKTNRFIGWDWTISDLPDLDFPSSGKSELREIPPLENPNFGKPLGDNKEEFNKEEVNKKEDNTRVQISEKLKSISGFTEAWLEWQKHKKAKRQTLTEFSIHKQLKFLEAQPDPVACIEQSILRNWQGLFEVKQNFATSQSLTPPTPPDRPIIRNIYDYHEKWVTHPTLGTFQVKQTVFGRYLRVHTDDEHNNYQDVLPSEVTLCAQN